MDVATLDSLLHIDPDVRLYNDTIILIEQQSRQPRFQYYAVVTKTDCHLVERTAIHNPPSALPSNTAANIISVPLTNIVAIDYNNGATLVSIDHHNGQIERLEWINDSTTTSAPLTNRAATNNGSTSAVNALHQHLYSAWIRALLRSALPPLYQPKAANPELKPVSVHSYQSVMTNMIQQLIQLPNIKMSTSMSYVNNQAVNVNDTTNNNNMILNTNAAVIHIDDYIALEKYHTTLIKINLLEEMTIAVCNYNQCASILSASIEIITYLINEINGLNDIREYLFGATLSVIQCRWRILLDDDVMTLTYLTRIWILLSHIINNSQITNNVFLISINQSATTRRTLLLLSEFDESSVEIIQRLHQTQDIDTATYEAIQTNTTTNNLYQRSLWKLRQRRRQQQQSSLSSTTSEPDVSDQQLMTENNLMNNQMISALKDQLIRLDCAYSMWIATLITSTRLNHLTSPSSTLVSSTLSSLSQLSAPSTDASGVSIVTELTSVSQRRWCEDYVPVLFHRLLTTFTTSQTSEQRIQYSCHAYHLAQILLELMISSESLRRSAIDRSLLNDTHMSMIATVRIDNVFDQLTVRSIQNIYTTVKTQFQLQLQQTMSQPQYQQQQQWTQSQLVR